MTGRRIKGPKTVRWRNFWLRKNKSSDKIGFLMQRGRNASLYYRNRFEQTTKNTVLKHIETKQLVMLVCPTSSYIQLLTATASACFAGFFGLSALTPHHETSALARCFQVLAVKELLCWLLLLLRLKVHADLYQVSR